MPPGSGPAVRTGLPGNPGPAGCRTPRATGINRLTTILNDRKAGANYQGVMTEKCRMNGVPTLGCHGQIPGTDHSYQYGIAGLF